MVLAMVLLIACIIFFKAFRIAVYEGEFWREKGKTNQKERVVTAERGNILAADGSLLATSLPIFEIRFDPNSDAITEDVFKKSVDSLAWCMATYIDGKYTPGAWRDFLIEKRLSGERYLLIKENATYTDLKQIQSFPLFNKGTFKGGLIVRRQNKRERPFGVLAHRTIGYIKEGANPIGLEAAFNHELQGDTIREWMIKVGKDTWMPLQNLTQIEPRAGNDILTTLDVNLQDIAQDALMKGLQKSDAHHGTAVIMDVKTGAIKAMANLGHSPDDGWWETYNYALGESVEPGSTFKLASMLALFDDEMITPDDTLDIEKGKIKYFNEELVDASAHGLTRTTVRNAFSISSNVGISKLVTTFYGKNPTSFTDKLKSFRLAEPTGFEISGEGAPYIKDPNKAEDQWSGTSLPWMSIGYELRITPLQLLTFYNGVANGGKMMKPYIVSEVQRNGETIERFMPTVLRKRLASPKAIKYAQDLLLEVVEHGTAKELKSSVYQFAGKTGTTQLGYKRIKEDISVGGYQASFAGYFPANDPIYSCIVVVNSPKGNFYGGSVAGPIFREISDKCMASRTELATIVNGDTKPMLTASQMPTRSAGELDEMSKLLQWLGIKHEAAAKAQWGATKMDSLGFMVAQRPVSNTLVPNVVGMGLRDAIFLIENRGLKVRISGYGKVVRQSIPPGTAVNKQTVFIALE